MVSAINNVANDILLSYDDIGVLSINHFLVTILPLILFALFVLIPILEIATFIQVGAVVGVPMTLFGILLTAIIGAVLVRQQGFKALNDARENIAQQKSPVEQVIHGVFILIAGLLLLTPGFLTDSLGFLFLIPPLRLSIAMKVWSWIKDNGSFTMHTSGTAGMTGGSSKPNDENLGNLNSGKVIDGEATEIKKPDNAENYETPWQPPDSKQ